MNNFIDFSGICIYQLLLHKEAARLGIVKEEEYENYVRSCLEKLTEQPANIQQCNMEDKNEN